MKTNYQNVPLLDMIFEHRNKSYGAYALRTSYDKTIAQSILVSLSLIVLLGFGKYLSDRLKSPAKNTAIRLVTLDPVKEIHLPKPDVVKPQPAAEPPKARAVNTQRNVEMRVVTNNQTPTDSIIPAKELTAESGLTNNQIPGTLGATDGKGTLAYAPPVNTTPADNKPPYIVEKMPEFPGGEKALMKFLAEHTEFPTYERELGLGGKVVSEFTVNEDGRVSDIKILKSPGSGFSKSVTKVVNMLPAFKPGMQQDRPVKVRYVLPFTFHVED